MLVLWFYSPLYLQFDSYSSPYQPENPSLTQAASTSLPPLSSPPSTTRPASPPPPPRPYPNIPEHPYLENTWGKRATYVREAFVHAYSGYRKHAMLRDELKPSDNTATDNFNGWAVTIYDALDTMWLMGLSEEFEEGVEAIKKLGFPEPKSSEGFAPFFETVIRHLGGALSAYALSGDKRLLDVADELGQRLLPVMSTPSGLTMYEINNHGIARNRIVNGNVEVTAIGFCETMSNQLEYKYLAHATGKKDYFLKTEKMNQVMYNANLTLTNHLFPTWWDFKTGLPANSQVSIGALADSAYEYQLKQWLMTSRSENKLRDLYIRSADAIIDNLLFMAKDRDMLYVTDMNNGTASNTFEHLSCFLPGLLALGVHTLELNATVKERHMLAANGLAYSCYMTYADTATGLGPDETSVTPYPNATEGRWVHQLKKWDAEGKKGTPPGLSEYPPERSRAKSGYTPKKTEYLLRPEAIESFYILWKTTGNIKWRERGWAVFAAIEKNCKTTSGYASITNVEEVPAPWKNAMPSYFLAETLKYLYLLFRDDDLAPLDEWVFNTEGHPFPIFEWKDWEKKEYNIT